MNLNIQNEFKTHTIRLSVRETLAENYPSLRFSLEIQTPEFKGEFDRGFWVDVGNCEAFISQLVLLKKAGKEKLV